ncbi:MAG: F0F1 ATP synthase subunit gamma [Candidatus Competibacter sp.]|nr:F0F1 ATP synthase subunit gamma [Candidatus Competibacter sp.]
MPTLGSLRHTVATVENLQGIVRTMKTLAAASIRQYEQAVAAVADYERAVRLGLAAILGEAAPLRPQPNSHVGGVTPDDESRYFHGNPASSSRRELIVGVVAFGSDHGLCGRFNEDLAGHIRATLAEFPRHRHRIMVVGVRLAAVLESMGLVPEQTFYTPAAATGIVQTLRQLLPALEQWRSAGVERLLLCQQHPQAGMHPTPRMLVLLPLDPATLQSPGPWPGRSLPGHYGHREALLTTLLSEWLFVAFFRACAESLASEHASRLLAMQNAERNIEDKLAALRALYHQQRQEAITTELLDVIVGFEALLTLCPDPL